MPKQFTDSMQSLVTKLEKKINAKIQYGSTKGLGM
jgi:hypothetical protein